MTMSSRRVPAHPRARTLDADPNRCAKQLTESPSMLAGIPFFSVVFYYGFRSWRFGASTTDFYYGFFTTEKYYGFLGRGEGHQLRNLGEGPKAPTDFAGGTEGSAPA